MSKTLTNNICEIEKTKVKNRLSKIAGQVNALKKRFDEDAEQIEKDPYEIVRQLATIKGSINGMITAYVEHYAKVHLMERIKCSSYQDAEKGIDELLEIIRVYGK